MCVHSFESGLATARGADKALARGDRRPLLGVPMIVKESFNQAGTPTTWVYPEHRAFIPSEEVPAIQRAKKAGAVVLGKTNVSMGLGD
jgi:amidase